MARRPLGALLVVLALAGCGSSAPKTPSATVERATTSAPTTTTTARTPEQEVEAAYLKSWDVYAKALRSLDDSQYPDVFADDALKLREAEFADLKKARTAVRISVVHHYSVQLFDQGNRALLLEAYENHSVLLKPDSDEPAEADPNEVVKRQYELRRIGETWKVVHVLEPS